MSKVISIHRMGGLGNQMFQYLGAISIAERVPGCLIANISLPLWNIAHESIEDHRVCYEHRDAQYLYPGSMAALLNYGGYERINYTGYAQRMENLPSLDRSRKTFRDALSPRIIFGSDKLVINVRGNEILDGRHLGYVLLPIDFYEDLINMSGLEPVFLGQLGDNPYCKALQSRFPKATFIPSQGPAEDFRQLTGAVNIVPSVSTFSWLACWLSDINRRVFMPLTGLFNPFQYFSHDFVPLEDDRYQFYLFPANYAVPVSNFEPAHAAIAGRWRHILGSAIREKIARGPKEIRSKDRHVQHFEENYYLKTHAHVPKLLNPAMPTGLAHYVRQGFNEYRSPFAIDPGFYVEMYPEVADMVGSGDFVDLHHHYVSLGFERGYQRVRLL